MRCGDGTLPDVDEAGPDAVLVTRGGLDWLLGTVREVGAGLAWTGRPDDDELNPTLYSGGAGIVVVLLEGFRHFGDSEYAEAAARGARAVDARHRSPVGSSVVDRGAADLVVGVEEGLGEQGAHVGAAEPVNDALAVALSFDQSGEAQFGQVLAGDRGPAGRDRGEGGDVEFGIAQRPQHPHAGGIGEQRE